MLLVVPAVADASAVTAKTKRVRAGNVQLAYRTVGQGPPLVMIMGLGGTMDAWDPALVDGLAKTRRVILFDNRGVGRSTTTGGSLTVHRMAQDTVRLIRALRLRRPDVLGWSMGGFIAQDLAANHPRMVRRLVLGATAPSFPRFSLPAPQVLQSLSTPAGLTPLLLSFLFPPDRPTAGRNYVRRITRRQNLTVIRPAVALEQTRAVLRWAASAPGVDPRRIRARALVAGGAEDVVIVPANLRTLAQRIPRARLKLYRDAGHGFLFQERSALAKLVRRFL